MTFQAKGVAKLTAKYTGSQNTVTFHGVTTANDLTPETAKATNPITYIGKNAPPFLIFHGNKDTTVSPSQSKILYDALIKNGVDAEFYVVNGCGHDFKYFYQPKTFNIIVNFLNRVLK